ncbi:glycerate kinase [archaeon]|nr:MAG: glycerate kinase [archaeon]
MRSIVTGAMLPSSQSRMQPESYRYRSDIMIIRKKHELLSHGERDARTAVLDIADAAVSAMNGETATRALVRLDGNELRVGDDTFDLSQFRNVYVIGAGKATYPVAKALEDVLGDRLTDGVIIVKHGESRRLSRIDVIEAGHPLPDQAGVEGVERMLEVANMAGKLDLIFCIITGGASALMPFPVDSVSLKDLITLNEMLLFSGAPIEDINAVRKHVSQIKGGFLAQVLHPAYIVNLIIIDEVAGKPWGPTIPDPTTFSDAKASLVRHGLWDRVPASVRDYIARGMDDPSMETPFPEGDSFIRMYTHVIGDNTMLCDAALTRALSMDLNALVLTSEIEGESSDIGIALASIAREVRARGRPCSPPCVLIAGGETTVTIVDDAHGKGGPNQEVALGAATKLAGTSGIALCAIGTDGTDGPTEIAGGIVDGTTMQRALDEGVDIHAHLGRHDASSALVKMGDAIYTSPTETNVMDLYLVVIV